MSTDLLELAELCIRTGSDFAAITVRQALQPVGGKGTEVFPPTYPAPASWPKNEPWLGYAVDTMPDNTKTCLLDSVPAQAHRMSALFKQDEYRDLVPQIVIRLTTGTSLNLLDLGHRVADFAVRNSSLKEEVREAILSLHRGNALPLARLSPTSLLFGFWDSRDTKIKTPRVLRSLIRARGVTVLSRSTVYRPAADYEELGVLKRLGDVSSDTLTSVGAVHYRAVMQPGGVLAEEILRLSSVSLVALRALSAGDGHDSDDTLRLRRYILALALVCLTATHDTCLRLREGCELVPESPAETWLVRHDGSRERASMPDHSKALEHARGAARELGIAGQIRDSVFDVKAAEDDIRRAIKKKHEEKSGATGKEQDSDDKAESA